jgi:hypothetical protein
MRVVPRLAEDVSVLEDDPCCIVLVERILCFVEQTLESLRSANFFLSLHYM